MLHAGFPHCMHASNTGHTTIHVDARYPQKDGIACPCVPDRHPRLYDIDAPRLAVSTVIKLAKQLGHIIALKKHLNAGSWQKG